MRIDTADGGRLGLRNDKWENGKGPMGEGGGENWKNSFNSFNGGLGRRRCDGGKALELEGNVEELIAEFVGGGDEGHQDEIVEDIVPGMTGADEEDAGGGAAGGEVIEEMPRKGAEIAGDQGAVVELAPAQEVGVRRAERGAFGVTNLEEVKSESGRLGGEKEGIGEIAAEVFVNEIGQRHGGPGGGCPGGGGPIRRGTDLAGWQIPGHAGPQRKRGGRHRPRADDPGKKR